VTFNDPDLPGPLRLQGRASVRRLVTAVNGGRTIYVSSRARGTGSGSQRGPYSSVASALKGLRPGDTVQFLPGRYTETVILGPELQGRADAPIILRGKAGVVFDASTEIPAGAAWQKEGEGVFAIKTQIAHGLVLQDGRRMYGYIKRDAFDTSPIKPSRVYFYDRQTGRLLVKTGDSRPAASHVYTCAGKANAFRFEGAAHVLLSDVEMRHTAGYGVVLAAGSGNGVINNTFTNCASGVSFINSEANNTAIHNNRLTQKGFEDFSWRELMDLHWEFPRDGIVVWTGRGTSIVGNQISGHHNSISLEPPPKVRGTARNTAFNRDLDVMFNILLNSGDDAIEADYGGVNMRIHGNRVRNANSGVSVAPCIRGPVYVTRNDFTFRTLMFKFGINKPDSHGACYSYHNSGYALTKGMTMGIYLNKNLPTTNKHFKNNIIYVTGTDLGVALRPGNTFDANCWFSDSEIIKFNWQKAWLKSLAAFQQASGQAQASLYADPRLRATPGLTAIPVAGYAVNRVGLHGLVTDPQASDLRVDAKSPCIDAGLPIRGINENFKGRRPDIGAHEIR
ncbi:right-handed parallel beta-helix repeat-containing protein, partial [Planctomycetota bacterium]